MVHSPWQNGRIERLFGTLKNEFMSIVNPSLPIDVQLKLFQHYYNQHRPHQALNYQTPTQVWNAAHREIEWRGSG